MRLLPDFNIGGKRMAAIGDGQNFPHEEFNSRAIRVDTSAIAVRFIG
jgi:hypothetical protein